MEAKGLIDSDNGLIDRRIYVEQDIYQQEMGLHPDEIKKLFDVVPDDFKDLIEFGILTGLRPQEMRAVTKTHLRTDMGGNRFIYFEHHKTSESAKVPKPRTVPLVGKALERSMKQKAPSLFVWRTSSIARTCISMWKEVR